MGLAFFLPPFTEPSSKIHLFTDAASSLGYGHPSHQLNPATGISIQWQELYPICLACMLWASIWANRSICFHCDNQATFAILSSKSSKIPQIMNLVRLITLQTLKFNFTFPAKDVPGLTMASLTVSLAPRWPVSAFSHRMHRPFLARSLIS